MAPAIGDKHPRGMSLFNSLRRVAMSPEIILQYLSQLFPVLAKPKAYLQHGGEIHRNESVSSQDNYLWSHVAAVSQLTADILGCVCRLESCQSSLNRTAVSLSSGLCKASHCFLRAHQTQSSPNFVFHPEMCGYLLMTISLANFTTSHAS